MRAVKSYPLKLAIPLFLSLTFVIFWMAVTWRSYLDENENIIAASVQSIRHDMSALQREVEQDLGSRDTARASVRAARALLLRGVSAHYSTLVAIDDTGAIIYATEFDMVGKPAVESLVDFEIHKSVWVRGNNRERIYIYAEQDKIISYFPLALERRQGEIRPSRVGLLYLVYDYSLDRRAILNSAWQSSLPVGLGLILMMLVVIIFLNRSVSRPIAYLMDIMGDLSQQDNDERCQVSGSGEFYRLANAYNHMADKLKQRFEKQQQAERETLEKKQLFRDILESTAEAIYGVDLEGNCTFANPACVRILGYRDADELVGQNIHQLIHYDDINDEACSQDSCAIYGVFHTGVGCHIKNDRFWRRDGMSVSVECWSYPLMRGEELTGAVVTFLDSTERKKNEQRILHQAHFDSLTDLPNRFLALDRLSQLLNDAVRNNKRVGVLFLDLDDFKKINDSLGHDIGDRLLVEASLRLRSVIRGDDTVARLGGDEFIILLNNILSAADAQPLAEKLLSAFRKPFRIAGREFMVTVSVGIAIYPEDGTSTTMLLRNADSAMYGAKSQGRNTYSYFTEAMNRELSRRLLLEEQMRGALERGEFEVYYQAKVDIQARRVVGVEALLRWHNDALGSVSPEEFIPVAEQTGLIVPIGKYVLTEALSLASYWHRTYDMEFSVAVNVSPRQFRDADLLSFVENSLRKYDVAAENLELEITEGVLMSGQEFVSELLIKLSDLGVNLAMDDFGTGYSSLSYLRRYPFHVLKIDRSFVHDMTSSQSAKELISATIAMAGALGMVVVAEGVETQEELLTLKEFSCTYAQGYLFSRPVPERELYSTLENSEHFDKIRRKTD